MKNAAIVCIACVVQVFFMVGAGHARTVSPGEVRMAAETWLRTSHIARSVLAGRSIATTESRGGIWLLRLSPSGYVILSSSDLAAPIVAFSDKLFVEPEPGTAFYDILHGAETGHARLEGDATPALVTAKENRKAQSAQVPDSRAVHRKARWEALIGAESPTTNRTFRQAQTATPSSSGVVVAPFLLTHWNQWQPWNDFAPVYNPEEDGVYRGRCPCGCTATASAQTLAYWKWPAYADTDDVLQGTFTDADQRRRDWLMRFSGALPLQWEGFPVTDIGNSNWDCGCDLRGKVAESLRFSLSRLTYLCDWLSEMDFKPEGSSAGFRTVADNALWYEKGRWVDPGADYANAVSALKADLVNRVPVQVTVPGHAVVGCGWAEEYGDHYIYLNYGWSGSNDGYYNVDDAKSDRPILEAYVGFKPRRMVQLRPIPKVVGDSVRLDWILPEHYRATTAGFSIAAERRARALATFADAFSELSGKVTGEGISIVADAEHGDGSPALRMSSTKDANYELRGHCMLSSRSVLSFEVYSEKMLSHEMRIEMHVDGAWTTVAVPRLNDYDEIKARRMVEVPLCDQGGKTVRFRIVCDYLDDVYYHDGYAWVDNFRVSDTYPYVTEFVLRAGGHDRSAIVGGLLRGSDYCLSVRSDEMRDCDAAVVYVQTAGEAERPAPGEIGYAPIDLAFCENSQRERWSVDGTVDSNADIQTGPWSGGFSVTLPGPVAAASRLSFGWTTDGYYEEGNPAIYDQFSVSFEDTNGGTTAVRSWENRSNVGAEQPVDLPLGTLAGRTGIIVVRFKHEGLQYASGGKGARFHHPILTDVTRLQLDADARTAHTLLVPSLSVLIQDVVSENGTVEEGFFVNCARGVNKLRVRCSPNVCKLKALPSLLSLVSDEHVFVRSAGNGEFDVLVNGSDIPKSGERSRMILTLVAYDANGTSAAKDLVLRFSSETPAHVCGFVRFLPNGGMGTMPDMPMERNVVYGLPHVRFSKVGMRFVGWAGSNGRRYDDGMLIFNLAEPGETVTMTAIWE